MVSTAGMDLFALGLGEVVHWDFHFPISGLVARHPPSSQGEGLYLEEQAMVLRQNETVLLP